MSQTAKMLFDSEEEEQDPMFRYVFRNADSFLNFASTRGIKFAPGLLKMLKSPCPPTMQEFKKLPQLPHGCKIWAVYLLVLEFDPNKQRKQRKQRKKGLEAEQEDGLEKVRERKFRIYIGSGTEFTAGLKTRFGQYDKGTTIPKEILDALEEQGYRITYRGILCWAPIPQDDNQWNYQTRLLFFALEAALSLMLWAMVSTKPEDYKMPIFCPWDVSDLSYKGCCTHVALTEVVIGQEKAFTPEELEPVVAIRKMRSKARKNQSVKRRRDSGAIAETAKGVRARAKSSGRFPCSLCNINGKDRSALKRHNKSFTHAKAIEELAKGLSKAAAGSEARSALSASLGLDADIEDPFLVDKIHYKLMDLVELVEKHAGKDEMAGRSTDQAKFAALLSL